MKRLRSLIAGLCAALTLGGQVQAASLTPPNLTAAVSIANNDLMLVWPTGSSGPLEQIQWSVIKTTMLAALGGSYLQVSNNLSDVASQSTSRSNLGLGTAAVATTGTAGHVIGFLDGANTWSGAQTYSAKIFSAASAAGGSGFNLASGVDPTSPVNGDLWNVSGAPKFYDGATKQTLAFLSSSITGSAATLTTGRTIAMTGDVVWTSPSFNGSGNVTAAGAIQAAAVTSADLRNSGALSVIGRSANSSGVPADISAVAASGAVLRESGSTIGFGTVANAGLANMAATTIKANVTGGSAAPTDVTIAALQGTTSSTFAAGNDSRFAGPTQNSQSVGYTPVLADAGGQIYHPSSDTTARTWTWPNNSNVAFLISTKIEVVNDCSAGVLTINTQASVTLEWFPSGATGNRTIAACGIVTLTKVTTNTWIVTGVGVSWNMLSQPDWMAKARPANDNADADLRMFG